MARKLGRGAAALVLASVLLAPARASADGEPVITERPTIAGVAREGETLTATATWTGDAPLTVAWAWVRCPASQTGSCQPIAGATSATYAIAAADVGSVLRVRVTVTNSVGTAQERSRPTSAVQPAPGEPAPSPTPTPTPPPVIEEPPAEQPPGTSFDPPATPVTAPTSVAPVHGMPLLAPFPVVRIRGRLTVAGARVTLLTVRSPRGAQIAARCQGSSCPVRRLARTAALTRLRPFERRLRAGTRLDITVRKAGYIGKWTTIVIRRARPPRRIDRCVRPGGLRPMPCPAG